SYQLRYWRSTFALFVFPGAAGETWRVSQDRIGIDVLALPVFFRIGNRPDRKMEMVVSGARVAGAADKADDIALTHTLTLCEFIGVTVQMRVIKDRLLILADLINRIASALVIRKPQDFSVGRRQHGRFVRGHNVDRVMHPSLRTTVIE